MINAEYIEHYNKGRQDATREIFEEIELWLAFDGDIRIITAEKFAELKKKHRGITYDVQR